MIFFNIFQYINYYIFTTATANNNGYRNDDICNPKGINGYAGMNVGWNGIQKAQYNVYTMNNNTGLVTSSDQGQTSLHYPYKQEISYRAYLWSRYLTFYDKKVTRKHAYYGIDVDSDTSNVNDVSPPIFANAYKKYYDNNLTVYINIDNAGPKGLSLQNAVNCSIMAGQSVIEYNTTTYKCCDHGGVSTVKFRLEGWYWYDHQGHKSLGVWNWVPGNITSFINNGINNKSTIVAQAIVPQSGSHFPSDAGAAGLYYAEATTIKEMEIQTSGDCSIVNSYGLPLSIGGPYSIGII